MKTKTRMLIAAVLITVMAAGNAFAWGDRCGDKPAKGGDKKAAIMRELGLTPDQEKNLTAVKEANRQAMKSLIQELKDKRGQLKKAIAASNASEKDIAPLTADIKKVQGELLDKKVEGIFKVKAILTPEQFNKLQQLKEKKMKHMNKHHEQKECVS